MFQLPHSFIRPRTAVGVLGLVAALGWLFPPSAASGHLMGSGKTHDQTLTVTAEWKGQQVFALYSGQEISKALLVAKAERGKGSTEWAEIEGEELPAVVPRTNSGKGDRRRYAGKGGRQRGLIDLLKDRVAMTADEYRERRIEILLTE